MRVFAACQSDLNSATKFPQLLTLGTLVPFFTGSKCQKGFFKLPDMYARVCLPLGTHYWKCNDLPLLSCTALFPEMLIFP